MPAVLLIVLLVALGIWLHRIGKRNRRKMLHRGMNKALAGQPFSPTILSELNAIHGIIAIDEKLGRVAVGDLGQASVFGFDDIIRVEPLFDGSPAMPHATGATTGAVVGLAVAGGIGAIVGALAGSGKKVSKLSLRIVTCEMSRPVKEVVFHSGPAKRIDDRALNTALKELQDWAARFEIILARRHSAPQLEGPLPVALK